MPVGGLLGAGHGSEWCRDPSGCFGPDASGCDATGHKPMESELRIVVRTGRRWPVAPGKSASMADPTRHWTAPRLVTAVWQWSRRLRSRPEAAAKVVSPKTPTPGCCPRRQGPARPKARQSLGFGVGMPDAAKAQAVRICAPLACRPRSGTESKACSDHRPSTRPRRYGRALSAAARSPAAAPAGFHVSGGQSPAGSAGTPRLARSQAAFSGISALARLRTPVGSPLPPRSAA